MIDSRRDASVEAKGSPYLKTKSVVRYILFLTGLTFFVLLIIHNARDILYIINNINVLLFTMSLISALAYSVLYCTLFHSILEKHGIYQSYARTAHMFFFGQIAKYVPGHFWSVFYQASFLNRPGATSSVLFANLDLTVASLLQCVTIAACLIFSEQLCLMFCISISGVFLFWLVSSHDVIYKSARRVLRATRIPIKRISQCKQSSDNYKVLCIAIGVHVTYIVSNILLLKAAFDYSFSASAVYTAYFALAWVIGAVSFFVPAGIGVREAVFIYLVKDAGQGSSLEMEKLAAIAIVFRFLQVIVELIGLVIAVYYRRAKYCSDCEEL